MRKITKNIYKYDELKEEVKEKVSERIKEKEQEFYNEVCLEADMDAFGNEYIKDTFGIDPDYLQVWYDLSYCQGSGAMVEFDITIYELNNKYHIFTDEEMRLINDKGFIDTIKVRHDNPSYYHAYSFSINYYYDFDYEYDDIKDDYNISEDEFNTIENRLDKLLDDTKLCSDPSIFAQDIININTRLEKKGYELIENKIDDEYLLELCNENEYYENGDVYYEN